MGLFTFENAALIEGDSREVLKRFAADRFDSCVSDPPYELKFMSKGWDQTGIAFDPTFWAEVLRVLKPGAHLLAFGATRTVHRMTCAIEDAGFEIRDGLDWLYGTGFPKSVDAARAIEMDCCALPGRHFDKTLPGHSKREEGDHLCPSIPAVQKVFGGRGTALKPGREPIVMARKPLAGTVAATLQAFGTGALNIDVCRIGDRFPSNVLFDEESAAELDAQAPVTGARAPVTGNEPSSISGGTIYNLRSRNKGVFHDDGLGGASRFFYVAKPTRRERDRGCGHLPLRTGGEATDRDDDSAGTRSPRAGAGRNGGARNFHPTVKPVALMRYLVRLVTPPGGTVIDPFVGSGTTGMGALLEERPFVGIEREAEYFAIAAARIAAFREAA